MVRVIHGGPYLRDNWGFNAVHQWLANRGYAVLSVNYRGSTGYGKAFVKAADREWGGKMHDDLIDAVWGGRIVSESTLTSHINAVRKAVGDTGEEQRLVRTIARKGYRFVGEVTETDASDSAERLLPHERQEPFAETLTLPDRPSIAVLPFLNLSGDPTQEYFVDGVVEDIISAFSRMVVSPR